MKYLILLLFLSFGTTEVVAQSRNARTAFSDYCLHKDTFKMDLALIRVFSLSEYEKIHDPNTFVIDIRVNNDYIDNFLHFKSRLKNFLKCPNLDCSRLLLSPPFDAYWGEELEKCQDAKPLNISEIDKTYYYTDKAHIYGAWVYRIKGKVVRAAVDTRFLSTDDAYNFFESRIVKQVDWNLPAFYIYFPISCDVKLFTDDIKDEEYELFKVKAYE